MSDLNELTGILLHIKGEKEMINLLQGLFTKAEIEEFARRIHIVRMIKKGVSHHEIAKKLGVGVATVTRGSKEIKSGRFQSIK